MPTRDLLIPSDSTDDKLIELWIRLKRSPHTRRSYRNAIGAFQAYVQKPLAAVTLEDALDFVDALNTRDLAENSKRLFLNVVKSLYSFGYRSGFFQANVFAAVKPPSSKSAVSHRILPESTVLKMIVLESNVRNHGILYILYCAGLRVSELCDLRWRHVIRRADGCQLDITHGKGDKQRHVYLPEGAWNVLKLLWKETTQPDDYVFQSRQTHNRQGLTTNEQRMDTSTIWVIVRQAAKQAGVPNWFEVSPHWLRHCHGSHSIDRGAPLSVVRDTMGHSNIAVTNVYIQARPDTSSAHYLVLDK